MERRIVGCLCYLVAGFPVGCGLNQRGNKKKINQDEAQHTKRVSELLLQLSRQAAKQSAGATTKGTHLHALSLSRSLSLCCDVISAPMSPTHIHINMHVCVCALHAGRADGHTKL